MNHDGLTQRGAEVYEELGDSPVEKGRPKSLERSEELQILAAREPEVERPLPSGAEPDRSPTPSARGRVLILLGGSKHGAAYLLSPFAKPPDAA